MAATATVAIDGGAVLIEDGALHLGELAPVVFTGYKPATGNTVRLTLFDCDGKTPLADNHENPGVLDLRGEMLRKAFHERCGAIFFYAVATEFTASGGSTEEVLATGQLPVIWSPMVFDAATGAPASLKGPKGDTGVGIAAIRFDGETEDGGHRYEIVMTDGSKAYFIAPRGPATAPIAMMRERTGNRRWHKVALIQNDLGQWVMDIDQDEGEGTFDADVVADGTTTPRSLAARFADTINVKDFGASGDGVTDDTETIQAALDFAAAHDRVCIASGSFKITRTIHIACDCEFSTATFEIPEVTSALNPVVTVGTSGVSGGLRSKRIVLPDVINAGESPSGTGIQFLDCRTCDITCGIIQNFDVGLLVTGATWAFGYNEVNLGSLFGNVTGLKIYSSTLTDGNGDPVIVDGQPKVVWTNQNVFFGGRFAETGVTQRHLEIGHGHSGMGPNNNTFIGCSLEGVNIQNSIVCDGSYNYFLNCRYEQAGARKVLLRALEGHVTWFNVIEGGFNSDYIQVSVDAQEHTTEGVSDGVVKYNRIGGIGRRFVYNHQSFSAYGSSASNIPHLRGYAATKQVELAAIGDVDWTWQLDYNGLHTKQDNVDFPQVSIGAAIELGGGSQPPRQVMIGGMGNDFDFVYWGGRNAERPCHLLPRITTRDSLGGYGYRWKDVWTENGSAEARLAALEAAVLALNPNFVNGRS